MDPAPALRVTDIVTRGRRAIVSPRQEAYPMRPHVIALAAAALTLAACGETRSHRALSGAGLGAGAGLIVDEPLAGAAVGAAAGALTSPEQIDLGTPIWRR
jgi:osmotically inducible lipoprotein OsmB